MEAIKTMMFKRFTKPWQQRMFLILIIIAWVTVGMILFNENASIQLQLVISVLAAFLYIITEHCFLKPLKPKGEPSGNDT